MQARRAGSRGHDLREIVNAILHINRTGISWKYLPHDFPLYETVYDYYTKREADTPRRSRCTACCETRPVGLVSAVIRCPRRVNGPWHYKG